MATSNFLSGLRALGSAARLPRPMLALLVLLVLARVTGAQTISGLSASEATVGSVFTVTGSGFGAPKPKVYFAQSGQRIPKTKLKVTAHSDSSLTVVVKKAIRGTFAVMVKLSNGASAESTGTIEILPPEITAVDTDVLQPNEQATITVEWTSNKKLKVSMGGKNAHIQSVTSVSGSVPTADVTFRIPGGLQSGYWAVEFSNTIASVASSTGINVVGGRSNMGAAFVKASLEGNKRFKARKISVSSSIDGPTIITATRKTKAWTITLPFVYGNDLAPQTYDATSATVHYTDSAAGVELQSATDLTIVVSSQGGSMIAGSFSGTLSPVTAGLGDRMVSGSFTFDGAYGLDDPPGTTDTVIEPEQDAPQINIQILALGGATGPIGAFRPGDSVAVTFRLAKDDGSLWKLTEMGRTRALISGPTINYQRVITEQSNVGSVAADNGGGSYTYSFPALPSVYLAPYNDSASFGADYGELTGQPLLDGTYTIGLYFEWSYTVEGQGFESNGTRTVDILIGSTPQVVVPRQVVKTENCNQCHTSIRAHGEHRRTSELCVLCHTSGAEDRNTNGATPGASIDWRVMIHKIHNGAHLPSVLGVTSDAAGHRDYTATPTPYELVGFGNRAHDFSQVNFPAWPNMASPMPRDEGYSALADAEQDLEDAIRGGVTGCALCHGDPDGSSGPLTAPAQGGQAFSGLSRRACGSCHDDWDPSQVYTSNGLTMGVQLSDNNCTFCHAAFGSSLAIRDAHTHPLLDSNISTGVVFDLLSVSEAGPAADMDGTVDVGEKVAVSFTISDSLGTEIDPANLVRHTVMISGPSENMNVLTPEMSIPFEVLTGSQPYTMNVPMRLQLEEVGSATSGADVFNTTFTPHWNAGSQGTKVLESTGFTVGGGSTTLATGVAPPVNYIDLVNATNFARDDYLVIAFGGVSEYLQIQTVEGNRLWFSSPYTQSYVTGPSLSHNAGDTVAEVNLNELVVNVDYSLTKATGTITELAGAFGDGDRILVTYTSDFVMPARYGLALNAGPDLGESSGTWAGKSLVSGTYSLGMGGYINRPVSLFGESQTYRDGAQGQRIEFLVGDASTFNPWDNIADAANCYSCHLDIQFHGSSRRGFDACIMCHGTAGSGDRPQYVAPNAPATDGVTINYRAMLHKIHKGADLEHGDTYQVIGYGSGYPDNYSAHTYDEISFPAMPSGTQDCIKCHGAGNESWFVPASREHPTEQILSVTEWTIACGSCHDGDAAQAHIDVMTSSSGAETCSICHGAGQPWTAEIAHKVR